MIDLPVASPETPSMPPMHFEHRVDFSEQSSWDDAPRAPVASAVESVLLGWSKSSSHPIREISYPVESTPTARTASEIDFLEILAKLLQAEQRASSVNFANASENLFEIRRLTGFTWARLSSLLNVDRRTLNNWAKGAKIRKKNREHIGRALEVLRFSDRGSSELNAAALDKYGTPYELSPFEAISQKNYEAAKQYLSYGLSRPHNQYVATDTASWIGEFQQITMHSDADGTEKIEPLPDEPMPAYRKRKIKRG